MNDLKVCLSFGMHLKKIRLDNSLSQEKLAELSDLDRTYISSVERGQRNISLVNICKLATALNIPRSKLLEF
ncbi:helix-turn-helix domain-containing protein [Vibrio sp. 10N.237.312.B06]|uniref:helix-turn-helix domain-containing protein n=1 Tax=Vibrio sp. 10N.237.312.B06 TaxID=3229974 RepID=UPI00354EA273